MFLSKKIDEIQISISKRIDIQQRRTNLYLNVHNMVESGKNNQNIILPYNII